MSRRQSFLPTSFPLESAPTHSDIFQHQNGAYREKMCDPAEGMGSFSIFLFRLRNDVLELFVVLCAVLDAGVTEEERNNPIFVFVGVVEENKERASNFDFLEFS